MAPPPVPASTNASTSSSVHTSSRARGAVKYVDTSDDDIRMDDRDEEHTPRRTRSVSKKRGVTSPGLQGPPAQRVRVDDLVRRNTFYLGFRNYTPPVECLWAMSKQASRMRASSWSAYSAGVQKLYNLKDRLPAFGEVGS